MQGDRERCVCVGDRERCVCRGTGRGVCVGTQGKVCLFLIVPRVWLHVCMHSKWSLFIQTHWSCRPGLSSLAGQSLTRMCGRVWPVRLHAGQGPQYSLKHGWKSFKA